MDREGVVCPKVHLPLDGSSNLLAVTVLYLNSTDI